MDGQALALDGSPIGSRHSFTFTERIKHLKAYGAHSQAYSTLQPGMKYFDMLGVGYIAYMTYWGNTFVLSDPICAPENVEPILKRFMKHFPNANFIQVSHSVATFLHNHLKLYATVFGSEARIDLKNWSLQGKKKQIIRTAINQANKCGIVVKERLCEGDARRISEDWIKTRKCKSNEIRFLIRPMNMTYTEGSRQFYAYKDGKAVGLIYFDPLYQNNQVISYVPSISRSCASFKQGLFYKLMSHAMGIFRSEGVPHLDLGLIPLYFEKDDKPHEAKLLKSGLRLVYEKGNFLFNFKGLAFCKSRFQGEITTTYCCHRQSLSFVALLAMFRLTRLV